MFVQTTLGSSRKQSGDVTSESHTHIHTCGQIHTHTQVRIRGRHNSIGNYGAIIQSGPAYSIGIVYESKTDMIRFAFGSMSWNRSLK